MVIPQTGTFSASLLKPGDAAADAAQTLPSALTKTHNHLTVAPVPVKVHVVPLAVAQLIVTGFRLDAARAHVHDQVEESVQQLHGKEVGPGLPVGLRPLQAAVTEEQQAAGLRGAKVEGYGAGSLGVPPGQCQEGGRRVKGDGLQGLHLLTPEHQVAVDGDPGVMLLRQPGQLQTELIVLVNNLEKNRRLTVSSSGFSMRKKERFIIKIRLRSTHTHTYMYAYMYICIHIDMFVYICMDYTCIYIHICTYTLPYIHIFTYIL